MLEFYRAEKPLPLLRSFLFSCTIRNTLEGGDIKDCHCGVYVNASTSPFTIQMTTCSCLSAPEADAGTTCMHVVALLSYIRERPESVKKTNIDPSQLLNKGGAWKLTLTGQGECRPERSFASK